MSKPSFKSSVVLGLVFACGAVAGSLLTRDREAAAHDVSAVVRVSGADAVQAVATAANPAPAAPPAPGPETGAWSGRRVANAGRAVTAMIRGGQAYGAGVVISERHVLTCLHVVESMRAIELSVAEHPPERARIVARDAKLDLAVLESESLHDRHARLGSVTNLAMGDRVFAMGAPQKMTSSLNSGIVSYVGRNYADVFYLQTDIPTNAGNSGGPVLDESGRVVGISSFILRDTQGLAFATPIDYAYQRFSEYFRDSVELEAFDAWLLAFRTPAEPLRANERRSAARSAQTEHRSFVVVR